MHRVSAFYVWLSQSHPADAGTFAACGLPTNTSRLHVLLRACKGKVMRTRVRRWHRGWRIARKFAELERTGKIIKIGVDELTTVTPAQWEEIMDRAGIVRTGKIEFDVDFQRSFDSFARVEMFSRLLEGIDHERWPRVLRRWEAKHKDWIEIKPLILISPPGTVSRICPSCEANVVLPIGESFIPCPECGSDR